MLLGFKKQFAAKILDGTKKFTIRNERKISPKVGETIHMYSGLRTKYTELISKEHKYTGCQKVKIVIEKLKPEGFYLEIHVWNIDSPFFVHALHDSQRSNFVKHDGFKSQRDFCEYWIEGHQRLTAIRTIYHWTDLRY
jgi:hypothetical protein